MKHVSSLRDKYGLHTEDWPSPGHLFRVGAWGWRMKGEKYPSLFPVAIGLSGDALVKHLGLGFCHSKRKSVASLQLRSCALDFWPCAQFINRPCELGGNEFLVARTFPFTLLL